jgi:hypothetical protein
MSVTNISVRKRLQSELALRDQQLNSFFKGATAGLALVDRDFCSDCYRLERKLSGGIRTR